MRSDWVIGEWGKACGPVPSGGGAAAGSVFVAPNGNELRISGDGRDYSTAECWEQFPGLSRVSHSGNGRGWRTTCKTKSGDPRQATVVTTINASDRQISFDETGQYQFVINGQNCTASVRRTRTLTLIQREGEAAPLASAAPGASSPSPAASIGSAASASVVKEPGVPAPNKPCAHPGQPERLEIRPARKLLRPGESFEFHSSVLDRAGCLLALTPVWKVVTEPAPFELVGPGRIKVAESAGEATVELQASLAGRSTRIIVQIASRDKYEALLERGGLNAAGESDEAAVARIATSSIGGASVVTGDDSRKRRILFVGVVGGSALVLGLLGFALVQHSRRKPPVPEPRTPRVRTGGAVTPRAAAPLAKICPTCREEYPPEAAFCPNDGNRLLASRGDAEPAGPSGGVCPVCGQGYDPGVLTCPRHGEELVPAVMQAGVRTSETRVSKKICPVCGTQYTGDSQFCGGCGAALVPVN